MPQCRSERSAVFINRKGVEGVLNGRVDVRIMKAMLRVLPERIRC